MPEANQLIYWRCCLIPYHPDIRKTLLGELPLSLARLRDAIPTFGVSPYVIDESQCLALQRHFFDAESRKTHVLAFAVKAGTAVIVLDIKRMYPSGQCSTFGWGEAFKEQ